MKVNRQLMAAAKEARDYRKAGWERCPLPLDFINGNKTSHKITAVEIGGSGRVIWIKTERKTK